MLYSSCTPLEARGLPQPWHRGQDQPHGAEPELGVPRGPAGGRTRLRGALCRAGSTELALGCLGCLWLLQAWPMCQRAGKVCGMESPAPWDVLQHSLDLAPTESQGLSPHMEQTLQVVRASTCLLEAPSHTG